MDAKCQRCLMKPNCPWELLQQHRHPQEEPRVLVAGSWQSPPWGAAGAMGQQFYPW